MRAFDHELGRRKDGRMDVGVGETKPVAKVMEGSSQVAQAPNQTRKPKDDARDISGVAINKCGFRKDSRQIHF